MILLNQTLRLFLDSIGRRDEYEFYLNRFHDVQTPAFAVVCPDRASVEQAGDVLLFDLQFLLRVELVPVILLAGPDCGRMQESLAAHGDLCAFLSLEGDDDVADFVREQGKAQRVPVLTHRAAPADALRKVVPAMARRMHWVRPQGALHSEDGGPIYYYYTRRENETTLGAEDAAVFEDCRSLVEQYDGVHVSVTSPINLLQELFTVKGAGTMIRRGSRIRSYESMGDLDRGRLLDLLGNSFGKPLLNSAFLDDVHHAHVEENYRGAALLEEHDIGLYLSKFAVGTEARGEGLAQELWREVTQRHPRMCWRSREGNPINHWYKKEADGRQRVGGWMVFWRGIAPVDIAGVIAYCESRPTDFADADG